MGLGRGHARTDALGPGFIGASGDHASGQVFADYDGKALELWVIECLHRGVKGVQVQVDDPRGDLFRAKTIRAKAIRGLAWARESPISFGQSKFLGSLRLA
jgi:hypothetical protein